MYVEVTHGLQKTLVNKQTAPIIGIALSSTTWHMLFAHYMTLTTHNMEGYGCKSCQGEK